MARFEGQEFEGRVPVDGHEFVACTFMNAVLVYSGGDPPSFRGCILREWRFAFEGPAGNTVNFLRSMAPPTSGFSDVVRQTFPDLAGP
jgi:hypothetical protein